MRFTDIFVFVRRCTLWLKSYFFKSLTFSFVLFIYLPFISIRVKYVLICLNAKFCVIGGSSELFVRYCLGWTGKLIIEMRHIKFGGGLATTPKFSRRHFKIFFFHQKIEFDISLGDHLNEMSKPIFWGKYYQLTLTVIKVKMIIFFIPLCWFYRDIMARLGEPLRKDELEEMINNADKNRNGKINYRGTLTYNSAWSESSVLYITSY